MKKLKKILWTALAFSALGAGIGLFSGCIPNEKCKHDWERIFTLQPTCMEYGIKLNECTRCRDTDSERIERFGHLMQDGECLDCGAKESVGLDMRIMIGADDEAEYALVTGLGTCKARNLIIPATYEGLPVKGIDDEAFARYEHIVSVYADVETVGLGAFVSCAKLQTIYLSDNVKEVGAFAFFDTAYYDDEGNWTDGALYLDDVLLASKRGGKFEVKEGTRVIANSAFHSNQPPTLTELVLPDSVEYIGESAFAHNGGLTSVSVGKNVKGIGRDIFLETPYERDRANWKNGALYLGDYLLKIKEGEEREYVVEDGTLLIAEDACVCHDNLVRLTLPQSLQYLNEDAFLNNYKLVEVCNRSEIPLEAGSIEPSGLAAYALYIYNDAEENSRISYTADGYVLYKEEGRTIAVDYVGEQTELIVPSGVTEILRRAFSFKKIASVVFPQSLETIGAEAFWSCDALTGVHFSTGLKRIETYAFEGCGIASLVLPEGLEWIGMSAFARNKALTKVTIPSSVYYIGDGAFTNCEALETATFAKTDGWIMTWKDEPQWRTFAAISDISLYEELLEKLMYPHAEYAFFQADRKEELYPSIERVIG